MCPTDERVVMPSLLDAIRGPKFDRDAAELKYRQILRRGDEPQNGDVEALRELMGQFSLTVDDVAADLKAIKRAKEIEEERAALALSTEEQDARREQIRDLKDGAHLLRQEADKREAEANALWGDGQSRSTRGMHLSAEITDLREKHRIAFGGERPVTPRGPSGITRTVI